MLSIKVNILYIVLFTAIVEIQSLLELSTEEDNNIKIAETIIRNTVNKLFTTFKIQESNQQLRLKQFFAIHDFFVSITLKDCDNLKEIVRLSRVNDIDNIQHLITQINEVLNESDKSSETNGSDIFVTKHIEWFIGKIKYLKDKYDTNKKNNIEAKILHYLNDNRINLKHDTEYNNSLEIKVETEKEIGNETTSNFTEYWTPSGRRIYKGFRTRIKHYPFMASVQFFRKFQCAGSIIKDDLVITSASCLQLSWNNRFFRENPAFLSVQIGSDFYEHGGENIDVQEIYFNPRYDPKTLRHNLALMRLSRRIAFKKKHRRVRKIDIDRNPRPLSGYDHITVVGWGARDSSNIIYNVLQNRLAYANLDFYPLDECQEHYTRPFVSRRNFCAGFFSKGSGACNRDAGGPAIIGYKLMGVISFGAAVCGSPDSPTVFTKLGYYADWIDKIMEQDVPSVHKRTTRLPEIIYGLEEKVTEYRTKKIRFTPVVVPTSSPVPIYINDLRMLQKESTNSILASQEIGELLENNNSELNKYKHKALETHKQKEVTIKNNLISHKIYNTPVVINKLRQGQSNSVESAYDSEGMSIELVSDITTQATIKITKKLYNEEYDNISIETNSEFINGNPGNINKLTQQRLKKDDYGYDSTETDPKSFTQSPTEITIKLLQQQVNDDSENLNKVSTKTVHSTNKTPKYKFTLLQFYEVKSDNVKNKIKHPKLRNVKKQKTKIFKAPVIPKIKTYSATTLASLNKPIVQSKYRLNRQFDEYRANDESIETDIEYVNSHSTEVENKLLEEQHNTLVSDDIIKKYVKQILNITNNKKKKSKPKVIKKLRMTAIATNVLPSIPIKPTTNKLKPRQFNEDSSNDESMEVVTESVKKYHTTLKNITQQQFNVGISDDVIKKYIMQYIKEKQSTRKHQIKSKRINIMSTNRSTTKVTNKLKQKPFIEGNKEIIEIKTESVNDKLTHQEFNVGGSHSIININKKQAFQTPQSEEIGTIKKVQIKPKLKTTTTTLTNLVLHESTAYIKKRLKQPQFDPDTELLNDKLKQQRFNTDGRHSKLIETDIESIKAMQNLEKGVNVRDIKNDIMTLIDNLDIEQLLDEVDNSKNETLRTGELKDTKKDAMNLKQWTSLKYLFSSDEEETALSAPAESSSNVSVTDQRHYSSSEIIEYNKIPKPILLDLVSLAVEEEIKRKTGASKAIVMDDII